LGVRRDYLQKLDPDKVETPYVDLVMVGWAAWSSGERGPHPPIGAGALLHMASERQGFYKLRISDDEFVEVDSRIALLAPRLRQIIELEYRGLWRGQFYSLGQEAKWRLMGLRRTAYSERLAAAQWTMYTLLLPHVEQWRTRSM